MGTNNKQRRAAKQRKRARRQGGRPGGSSGGFSAGASTGASSYDPASAYALAQAHVSELVQRWLGKDLDGVDVLLQTGAIAKLISPAPERIVAEVVLGSLADVLQVVVRGGWTVSELRELVQRAHESWLLVFGSAVEVCVEAADHKESMEWETPEWLPAYGDDERLSLIVAAEGLGLLTMLCDLPLLDGDAVAGARRAGTTRTVHPKWQQVRSLLAKAESTEFGPEAEALVAKAQELITKHALDRLVGPSADGQGAVPSMRRIWLDRPYLAAKAALVGEVARANRCQSAFAERYQFSILVGDEADLEGVELLVTSLLLQADTAMFIHGRRGSGSRSKSFRQSFLMAYSTRIGERLRQVDEAAIAATSGAALVLHDHESRIAEAFHAMVPTERARSVKVTDEAGWVAGTTAADLARLDVRDSLER